MTERFKSYQVGHLTHFEEDDPVYNSYEAAIHAAMSRSASEKGSPIAIWSGQGEGSELLVIVVNEEVFRK